MIGEKLKLAPLILAVLMATTTAPALAYHHNNLVPQQRSCQAAFADTTGTWCDTYAQTCYEAGLMEGKSTAKFDPEGTLTNAQITVICARLLSLLQGGDSTLPAASAGEAWYQPSYDALAAGNVLSQPDDNQSDLSSFADWQADSSCSRGSFVELLSGVLTSAGVTLPAVNSVTALPDVSAGLDSGFSAILSFYNAGILSGRDQYGSFAGSARLNRGQAAAMLTRIVDPAQRLTFTLRPFDLCRDVLQPYCCTPTESLSQRSCSAISWLPL